MKIFLKGNNALPDFGEVDSTDLVDLKDAEITLRKKTGENFASSFSKDLVFSGAAFKYLKTYLVLAENARTNVIILEVYDNCCYPEKQIFRGKITANSIDYCFRDEGAPSDTGGTDPASTGEVPYSGNQATTAAAAKQEGVDIATPPTTGLS